MRHSIHGGTVAALRRSVLCAGLALQGAGGSAAGSSLNVRLWARLPWFTQCSGAEAFRVSTDEPMMASMAGRYAAALFELAKDSGNSPRSRPTSRPSRPCWTKRGPAPAGAQPRHLRRRPGQGAHRRARQGRHLGPHRQLLQADRPQPPPVRRRRHDQGLPRAAGPRARRGHRRRGQRPCAQRRRRCSALKDALRAQVGKDVQINTRVDPNLLGGLVVKMGSKMIDSSLRTKLDNLKVAMKGIG